MIALIVTDGLVLALAAAVLGLVVAQTAVRHAWARASQIIGDSTGTDHVGFRLVKTS